MATDEEGTDWRQTNLGGIGSAADTALRLSSAQSEESFEGAGTVAGIEAWRVAKFAIARVPLRAHNISLYSGDAYIILNTIDNDGVLDYALHYWIGRDCTQDEAGAVAYFAVVLDDLLGQKVRIVVVFKCV